jgi:hypothetical protein
MAERVATWFVWVMYAYAWIGGAFSILFVARGVQKVDSQAQGSELGFRLLIFPGVAAFWPLFIRRWMRATGEPPEEGNPPR